MLRRASSFFKVDLSAAKVNAYTRLGRYSNQAGTQLLFWPCAWGVALGASNPVSIAALAAVGLFWFGAFNARSAGCAVNDYFDKDFDGKVERTKLRPLANKELTGEEVAKFTTMHLSGGLLTLFLMKGVAVKQALAIIPLSAVYPLAKRYTDYAQVVLGVCFNSGILIGFAQASGATAFAPLLPIYAAGILWTVVYDSVYALQDVEGDKKLGLRGLAVKWDKRTLLYSRRTNWAMMLSFLLGGVYFDLNLIYHLGIILNSTWIHKWLKNIDPKDKSSFMEFFKKNTNIGFIIFLLIILGRIGSSDPIHAQIAKEHQEESSKSSSEAAKIK